MTEYIERAALKRELAPYEENDFSQQMDVILAIVDAQPTADVAPVRHGRWIELSRASKCSECGFETGRYEPPRRYCPECGALMDGNETPTCHDGVCEIPGMEEWG